MTAYQIMMFVLAAVWLLLVGWYVTGVVTGRRIYSTRGTWALLTILGLNIMCDCVVRAVEG